MSEWKEYKLIDVLDALIDYRGKTPKKVSAGIPLITAKIIKNGNIEQPTEFIAEEDYDSWMVRGFPRINDVVLTTEAPLGEVAQLNSSKIALAQRVVVLRGKEGILDNTYLKYYFLSHIGKQRLIARETGTTVVGIKQSELKKVLVDCPPYSYQKKIVSVLKSLDDKIELNRRINENLEQQAQAVFKHWFVEISNGTKIKLSNIATFNSGYSYKGNELSETSNIAMATIKNFVRNGGFKIEGYKNITPSTRLKKEHYAQIFDILVAHTDLTQNADVIGNAELLLTCGNYDKIIFSMDLVKVLPKDIFPYKFLLAALLKNPIFKSHCLSYVNGTTVLHLNKKALPEYVVTIPNDKDAHMLNNIFKVYYQQMAAIIKENEKLLNLRDTLLPKLINGELKIG